MLTVFTFPPFFTDYFTVFFAILIEAVPFITLGVLVSGFLTVFIRDEWLLKLIPKQAFFAHLTVAFLGFLFPVCECGNVPVARRLITKGLPVSQAVTFLLAAPVINPVVILATYTAFHFAPEVVYLRVGISLFIALTTGLIVSRFSDQEELLTTTVVEQCGVHDHFPESFKEKIATFLSTTRQEVFEMTSSLLVGAAIASATTNLPRNMIISIAHNPLLAALAMMTLALVLSICSTVDAFVALGYVGKFPTSAILAFLIFGPMIDFRVISMMRTTFKWKLVLTIFMVVAEMVLSISILLSFLGK